MSDERRGLPSASSMHRLSQCPGSHALITELEHQGRFLEGPEPLRDAGTRIHAYLAARISEPDPGADELARRYNLSAADRKTAEGCEELRDALIRGWGGGEGETIVEWRLWYPNRWIPKFSGQPDFVLVDLRSNRALVVDYKTGRKEQQPVADNLQLRALAVLLKANRKNLTEISGAIIEPWVNWELEQVRYNERDLEDARGDIEHIVDESIFKAERRIAGPHCQFCAARTWCQQARDYVDATYKLGVKEIAELPLGERGSKIVEHIKTARSILDQMEAAYKQVLIANPDALGEHHLHEGKLMQSVSDIAVAKERLRNVGFSDADFDECATYWVSRLREKFTLVTKQHQAQFFLLMNGLVEEKRGEGYIAKLSKKEREKRLLIK